MSRKKCVICGDIFHTPISSKRYCSETCRKVKRGKQQREWVKKNPNYMKDYMAKYRSNKESSL